VPLSPPLPMRPEPPPRLHRYDEGTEEGLRGYVVLELFGGIGTGAMAMVQAGIRVRRYLHVDPEEAGFEAAVRGLAALTEAEPWLFPQETAQRARQERRRYIQEASHGWLVSLGGVDVVIAGWPARVSQGRERGEGWHTRGPTSSVSSCEYSPLSENLSRRRGGP